ncbi:site-specific integrase [Candidatus Dependentiae bacterium]|nr:site-specific integrase [Candidatus Dependentiae bacterium]
MNLSEFTNKINDFLSFLEVEKNVSTNTLRAYQADLNQLIDFWNKSLKLKKI